MDLDLDGHFTIADRATENILADVSTGTVKDPVLRDSVRSRAHTAHPS